MKNFALGQYLPLNSWIHRLDPRIKILSMMFLMVSVFLADFKAYILLGIFLILAVLSAKLTFKFIMKSMKPMMFMLIFLFIINMLVIRTGYVIFSIWNFTLYSDALVQTGFILGRLVFMIMITTLLTATTAPLDLTLGLEDLLAPFRKIGVPSHVIAMMISIVLRFIPTLIEDTQRIMQAQASRGVDLDEGSIKEKVQGIISMILPLFVSAFQRAEDLADAMEARGYYPGKVRTRYKQLEIKPIDIVALIGSMGLVLAVVLMKRFL